MATFNGARVVGGRLNLRASASTSSTILERIPNGTSLNVSDYNQDWLSTSYSGSNGYVMREFIDVSRSSNRSRADVFSTNTLKRGHTGQYIYNLQHYLNRHGAGLGCDGVFGPATEDAVENYQGANGLSVDGEVGINTKTSLLDNTFSVNRNPLTGLSGLASRSIMVTSVQPHDIKKL